VAKIVALPTLTDGNCEAFLADWWNEHRQANRLRLETDSGEVIIELAEAAPLHSANLHYKTSRNYYSPSEFVRVVPEFVVQGGNSEDPLAQERRWLIGKHTLPAEFTDELFHHRGAVAMGRTYEGNPEKRSASYDFYIVVGRKVAAQELFKLEQEKGFAYPDWAKERYLTEGGAPHLDREHTVFGRVVEGMEVVDKLSRVRTDASDWPVKRLEFRMAVAEN
jgi:peptidyl-prolyl cis-trans isomerase B (cyclophilin B)